ncbi:MAG: DUF1759 domain-containing protein, partial [Gammaproteobacteria bacterium]|nr:DUF1759 domain-containing protein [Gammaproteobacteria bacterium]
MVDELDFYLSTTKVQIAKRDARFAVEASMSNSGSSTLTSTRLPVIDLPKFNGDSTMWKSFWDMFQSSVHSQSLPDIQKFNYLVSSLSGSAASEISGLAVTGENYAVALDLLKQRFGEDHLVISALYSKLRGLKNAGSNPKEIRVFFDALVSVLRQLRALGEDTEQRVLVDIICGKIPSDVLREMQKVRGHGVLWTVGRLEKCLRAVVQDQEEVMRMSTSLSNVSVKPEQFQGARNKFSPFQQGSHSSAGSMSSLTEPASGDLVFSGETLSGASGTNLRPCVFCGGEHFHSQWGECITVDERLACLEQKGGVHCYRCLKPGHVIRDC